MDMSPQSPEALRESFIGNDGPHFRFKSPLSARLSGATHADVQVSTKTNKRKKKEVFPRPIYLGV